jgi:hypothetical protein
MQSNNNISDNLGHLLGCEWMAERNEMSIL